MTAVDDALAALATVRDEAQRLREQAVGWRAIAEDAVLFVKRAEAAEERVRQLEAGLREIAEHVETIDVVRADIIADRIRALLAASPPDGGGAK